MHAALDLLVRPCCHDGMKSTLVSAVEYLYQKGKIKRPTMIFFLKVIGLMTCNLTPPQPPHPPKMGYPAIGGG